MVTRKKKPEPEPIENTEELGPVPPLSPIPDELDPAKKEAPPRSSIGPDWPIWIGGAVIVILFILLVWFVTGR